jgi:hypothetical protein
LWFDLVVCIFWILLFYFVVWILFIGSFLIFCIVPNIIIFCKFYIRLLYSHFRYVGLFHYSESVHYKLFIFVIYLWYVVVLLFMFMQRYCCIKINYISFLQYQFECFCSICVCMIVMANIVTRSFALTFWKLKFPILVRKEKHLWMLFVSMMFIKGHLVHDLKGWSWMNMNYKTFLIIHINM